MLILLKHILRNIRENRFRSILIIFSLAISTMVLFLNLTIKDDVAKKYTSVMQGAYQDYDISIEKNDPDGTGYFDEKDVNLSGVKTDRIFCLSFAYGTYIKGKENITVNLFGSDRQVLKDTGLCTLVKKSDDFDTKDNNQIIVSKKAAKRYNWKLNDEITIYTKDGEHKLKLTGIAKSFGFFLGENDGVFIMTTKDFTCKSAGEGNKIRELYLDLPKGTDLDKAKAALVKANSDYMVNILVDQDSIDSALTMINQLLSIILFMVICLNIFVITSITKLIMATRIPVVGTFRSVGASKWKMNFILILENAIYGIIGAVIGIILGVLVRNPMSGIFITAGDAFDYLNIKLEYKASYFVLSVLFAVGLQILITLSSILKAGRRSIKDSIFNTLRTQAKISRKKTVIGLLFMIASVVIYFINTRFIFGLSILALALALFGAVFMLPLLTGLLAKLFCQVFGKLFGGSARLGMNNISSSKTIRSSITLVTVGLSLILLVYGAINSMNTLLDGSEMAYDIQITGVPEKATNYQNIEDMKGIDHIKFDYFYFLNGKMNGKKDEYAMVGADHYFLGIQGDNTLIKNLKDNEILIDEYYAYQHNLKIGKKVALSAQDFKNRKINYTIAGFINSTRFSTRRNVFIITVNSYTKELLDKPSVIEVYADKGQNVDRLKKDLIKKLAGTGATAETKAEYLKSMKDSNQSLINMVTVILGLSVLLAVFGLINNQMIGFIQRKREYAVLYSVSMSRAQLRKMIFFESLGTFLAGTIFAAVLSEWLIKLLFTVLKSIGMGFPIELQLIPMLQVVGVVLLVLLITAISPMRKISKLNIINELKYE